MYRSIYDSVIRRFVSDYMGSVYELMCQEFQFLYAMVFKKNEKYYCHIYSKNGFTNSLHSLGNNGEVKLITLRDMYE